MTNTYTDCISYSKQPTGLVLAGYIGNMARISTASLGATSLTVPGLTVALNEYDAVYVFDGPSSEELQVGAGGAALNATSIPLLNATQFAHNAGTPYCTDGTSGSLGEQIFTASKWIEDDICYQALWSTAYTSETLTMPTMRAAIDNQANIHFRPRHFPISTVTSIVLQDKQKNQMSLNVSLATVDSDQQTVDIPLSGSQQPGYPWTGCSIGRGTTAWIILSYTSGFTVGSLPKTIERACGLLTSDCFGQVSNPQGADSIVMGKRNVAYTMRGDLTGESLLVKQAMKLLSPYVTEAF